jgi:hypothetical protein
MFKLIFAFNNLIVKKIKRGKIDAIPTLANSEGLSEGKN